MACCVGLSQLSAINYAVRYRSVKEPAICCKRRRKLLNEVLFNAYISQSYEK